MERNKIRSDRKDSDNNEGTKDVEKNIWLFGKKSGNCNRISTDKYWSGLFFIALPCWIISWIHVIHRKDTDIKPNNSTAAKDDFAVPYFVGQNWILDTILCNTAFLSGHYQSSGSVVIWANVLFCGSLIIYSISSMKTDTMFNRELEIGSAYLIMFTTFYRLHDYFFEGLAAYTKQFLKKVQFWVMPELILIMILLTKKSYTAEFTKTTVDKTWPSQNVQPDPSLALFALHITLGFLIVPTISIVNELDWDSALSYAIVAGNCYVGLTIFYFMLMATSCMTKLSIGDDEFRTRSMMEEDVTDRVLLYLWRGFVTVGRYHFGTACYHATLIFPRLETLFVLNDAEVKKLRKFSNVLDRHYLTQWKLHNLSLATTVVSGSNHSESIKKLSRAFSNDLQRLDYFQNNSQITRSLLALLMSTNSLLLITLWAYGLDDPLLSLDTWKLYIYAVFILNVYMKLFDVAFDTAMFYMDHVEVDYPQKRWVYVDDCLIK